MRFHLPPIAGCLMACCGLVATLNAQDKTTDAAAALEAETRLVAAARHATKHGDHSNAETQLAAAGAGSLAKTSSSVLLARRTAEVCAWLRNENDHGRAIKLAERVIDRLDRMKETDDADRLERLYWEATLEAQVLDHKVRAIELLKEAEKLAPEDERVIGLALSLTSAVAQFGR